MSYTSLLPHNTSKVQVISNNLTAVRTYRKLTTNNFRTIIDTHNKMTHLSEMKMKTRKRKRKRRKRYPLPEAKLLSKKVNLIWIKQANLLKKYNLGNLGQ